MHALDRLIRTTAFRLTTIYLALFIAFATLVLGYTQWHARRMTEDRITQQIEQEVEILAERYRRGGERRLADNAPGLRAVILVPKIEARKLPSPIARKHGAADYARRDD